MNNSNSKGWEAPKSLALYWRATFGEGGTATIWMLEATQTKLQKIKHNNLDPSLPMSTYEINQKLTMKNQKKKVYLNKE